MEGRKSGFVRGVGGVRVQARPNGSERGWESRALFCERSEFCEVELIVDPLLRPPACYHDT